KNPMSCANIAEKAAALGGFSRYGICEWMIFQHFPWEAVRNVVILRNNKNRRGFTLLEAVIALALWLILSLGIFFVWQYSVNVGVNMLQRQSAFENARLTIDALKMNFQMSRTITLRTDTNDVLQMLTMNQRDPNGRFANYSFRFNAAAAPTAAQFQRLEQGNPGGWNEFAENIASIQIIHINNSRMRITVTTGCYEPIILEGSVCVRYKDVTVIGGSL
ncbi:MAG: type II secretion system GspH family protein, partial [Defluviitaleaceae bacterium]|nr:type II secretion system GspH family protein [Defluviitaleaceae bacterium]